MLRVGLVLVLVGFDGSSDLGVVPPENGGLRAPALTGSSRRGETNQPTGDSSS